MEVTTDKIKALADVDAVVGNEVKISENVSVIPVSKISYAFASGGTDFSNKNPNNRDLFGGGAGSGITITPVGFLVINNGIVSFLQIESFSGAFDRLIAMAPDIFNKISASIKHKREEKKNNNSENL
jgi:sporulation protein YtfJ